MAQSQARISTASGSRYLQQVCKHWSHKFQVEFTPQKGHIIFADGRTCDLEAAPGVLVCTATSDDPAALDRLQNAIVEHVKRFAFREDLGAPLWTRLP